MNIDYKNNKLRKICTNANEAKKVHGDAMAKKIHQRMDEILATPTLDMLLAYRIGGCHALTGNKKGQYAMHLVEPFRLIFIKKDIHIEVVTITSIEDYH